ncbi:DinB family protein [Povalibacter sp.]|uniref:DinB family protein n=1 Tax=Povalibacter sp. TaxID=1962978 RepID=UPI002F3FCF01
MNPTTLHALTVFPDQLEAHYRAIPSELRHWAPASWEGIPSEYLTAIEQICHVRDIEIEGYQVRFRRTLEEDTPALAQIDTDAFAKDRAYASQDVEAALTQFRAARARSIELLATLTPEQLARRASFDGYGSLTLRSLVHYLCSHDQQHLAGLQWLLGKMNA